MITDEKKIQIESLPTEEMLYEINLGRRSRFQREKFAYLQTCYKSRIEKEKLKQSKSKVIENPTKPSADLKARQGSDKPHKIIKVSLFRVAEGVVVVILGAFALYLLGKFFGVTF